MPTTGRDADADSERAQGKIVTVEAGSGEWKEERNWMGGSGKVLLRLSSLGEVLEQFAEAHMGEIVMAPRAFCGYHVHEGWQEILHIVSGQAEHFEDDRIRTLKAGDTVIVGSSGGAHALRNSGDAELKAVGWYTLPKGATGSITTESLPSAIAHWASE